MNEHAPTDTLVTAGKIPALRTLTGAGKAWHLKHTRRERRTFATRMANAATAPALGLIR